jgi:hypothetical protein
MKKISVFILLILHYNLCISQIKKEQEFVGTIQLENKEIISFKLNYKEFSDGKITGTSLTDIYGNDRTSSNIIGTIDTKKNKISFQETRNISTKSKSKVEDFCFIQVKDASFKSNNGKSIIYGSFIAKFSNGKNCAKGNIYLVNTNYLEKLESDYLNKNYIKNSDTLSAIKVKVNNLKLNAESTTIKKNEVLQLNWSTNDLVLEIWDGEQEDQDEIEVYINDIKIVDKILLKRQKKVIVVLLKEELNTITIVGVNEGLSAPCTANIILKDGEIQTKVTSVLKKQEKTTIKINKTNDVEK